MFYTFGCFQHDTLDELNETLAQIFWELFGDVFGDDEPAEAEAFNNWTDAMCKDGDLCERGYRECSLIYTASEARQRGWI